MSDTISSMKDATSKKKIQLAGMVEPKEYYIAQDIIKYRKAGPDVKGNSSYVNAATQVFNRFVETHDMTEAEPTTIQATPEPASIQLDNTWNDTKGLAKTPYVVGLATTRYGAWAVMTQYTGMPVMTCCMPGLA